MKQARTFREIAETLWAGFKALSLAVLLESKFIFNQGRKCNSNLIREQISLTFDHQNFPAVLVTCRCNQVRPVFLLVKGLPVYQGKQLLFSRLARSLAMLGFHVLVYEDPELNFCSLEAKTLANLRGIISSIHTLSWVDRDRVIVGGSDFGARFLLTLFQDSGISFLTKGLVLFSPVRDLEQLREYAFSGKLKIHKRCKYLKPATATQVVFLWNVIRKDRGYKIDKITTGVMRNILLHRKDVALRGITQLKDEKLRAALLSLLRGEISSEVNTYIQQTDCNKLQADIFKALPQADLKKPVFLFQDISDREIDAGQSVELFDRLNSSAGIYLRLSQHLNLGELRSFWSNPASKLHNMAKFARLFYRIFAILISDKNLPFNPEGKFLRYRM
jgi:hypothetical protein